MTALGGNLASESGLIGVPLSQDPYADLDGPLPGTVLQEFDGTIDVEGGEQQFTIDHSASLDEGVTVLDPNSIDDLSAVPGVSSAEDVADFSIADSGVEVTNVDVNSEAGETTVTVDADSNTDNVDFDGYAHLVAADEEIGVAPVATTGVDVVLEGADGPPRVMTTDSSTLATSVLNRTT